MADLLYRSSMRGLRLVRRGKVRDIYAVDDDHLLIVATDRLSAFDVVLPTPIPGKGRVLTALSNFWFALLADVAPNHLAGVSPDAVLNDPEDREQAQGRAVVVRRLSPLPVEAIVRGYLAGTGWKDYVARGEVCGVALPLGLRNADRLPAPIYTPSTKAEVGDHDENISFARTEALLGPDLAARLRRLSLELFRRAAEFSEAHGIIVADTKFEFGLDESGSLVVIDEVLTPDSSRFWSADSYRPGSNPPSFDKQYVRDYLEASGWDKRPPAPELPPDVIAKTSEKYHEALRRLTGRTPLSRTGDP
jgi:phosphoribosylaminoimidazole-succinocarboxamide synthase